MAQRTAREGGHLKRFTDTDIWDSEWFMELTPDLKCLWLFMRSKCDAAGVWNPNWRLATLAVGSKVSDESLKAYGGRAKKIPTGILITDFITEQYSVLNPQSSFHKSAFVALKRHNLSATGVPLECHSDATVVAHIKEKEEVKEKEKEEGMQVEFMGNPNGVNLLVEEMEIPQHLRTRDFTTAWAKWKEVRRLMKKPKGSWNDFFNDQLGWLRKFPEGVAVGILHKSTINRYQGLFEPPGYFPGQKTNGHAPKIDRNDPAYWENNTGIPSL